MVDGDVKDEIGGGACQVSSTLYAATLFSFLETVERECHYFPVNYMQMGTDATGHDPRRRRTLHRLQVQEQPQLPHQACRYLQ